MSTSAQATWPRVSHPARRIALSSARVREAAPLAALIALAALVYFWDLTRNGDANQYYAAAVHAGTQSWKAFLFGSLDAANYITVDKPPASLWLMELSSRVFGFSSFSLLLPQALEGIASVVLLYATVRRWFGRPAALLSGVLLALTPVAALMFRFNNPDALLVLLMVLGAYAVTRALERAGTRWLLLAGTALGLAFLTKMMQAFVVLPAFVLVYLVAAPVSVRRRLWQLLAGGAAMLVAAGWWVALVELWPASARPYVGGSTNDSILSLIFGYNGLDRISGNTGGASFSGTAGPLRLFNSILGGQISWLLPAAVIALVAGLVWTWRRERTDRTRAALLLWGAWLAVMAVVYSYMTGVIHPYYTNTLAPAIAVLCGVGGVLLWQHRSRLGARLVLSSMVAATAGWAYVLLDRTPTWHPWLRVAVLVAGLAGAVLIACWGAQLKRAAAATLAATALFATLAAPAAYTLSTISTTQTGSNPSAGPAAAGGSGFGGGAPFATTGSALGSLLKRDASKYTWVAATSSAQNAASIELATGKSVMAIGGFSGSDPAITLAQFERLVAAGKIHYYIAGGGGPGGGGPGVGGPGVGGGGGALNGRGASAFGGAQGGPPGGGGFGFTGRGAGGGPTGRGAFGGPDGGAPGGAAGGQSASSEIASWVESHFKSTTVGGTTIYNLTEPEAG